MKKKMVFLLALSVILITAITMNSTLAYFTSYAEAKGGYVIDLSGGPNMEETLGQWTKRVVITNDGQPVYVRVKAFVGTGITLQYDGEGWEIGEEDDYYYFQGVIDSDNPAPGVVWSNQQTTELLIAITPADYDPAEGESFNVIVIYETSPVQYDGEGNPHSDWSLKLEGGTL